MKFGTAIEFVKAGARAYRAGWNGKKPIYRTCTEYQLYECRR